MRKYNTAIIGCGTISEMHANVISSLPGVELISVADIDNDRVEAAARRYGCKAYSSYRDVISDPDIDTIHICTPHYLHSTMAIDAMKAGKHVLTEKPMAISVRECEEMIRVSDETKMQLGVCFQNRFNITSLHIRKLLQSGSTGSVLTAKASVTWLRKKEYYLQSNWRGTWDKEGGGVMINQAIHTLDLLQWFIGRPISIKGTIDTRMLSDVIEVEDTAEATILFENDVHAFFFATNGYANSPAELEIVCENAVIKLSDKLTVQYKNGDIETITDIQPGKTEKSYYGAGHFALIENFYNSLSAGEPFSIDGRQGIEAVRLIQGLYNSSKTGAWFNL